MINPFDSDVVTDPENPSSTDVLQIHRAVFDRCRLAYEKVAVENASWSVLLYGEAGCGKTHLLSRFRKWLGGALDTAPAIPPALFVAVRMETGPGRLWRHLRRRFVEELLRRSADTLTPLDRVLQRFAAGYGGDLGHAFELAQIRDLGHDLMRVLEHFAAGQERKLCRAWLLGDGLSDLDTQVLNLPLLVAEETEEDGAESDARRVVLALTRLCAPAPVVFCFDQVEALALDRQTAGYGAFNRMGASLVDETRNSLVVSTVLASFLQQLRNASSVSDYQRVSKDLIDLHPLSWEQGLALVHARLNLAPNAQGAIAEADLRAFYQAERQLVTPRRLIHEARRLFAKWQGVAERPQVSTQVFLRDEFERMWSESPLQGSPSDADEVLSHGLPAAMQILGHVTTAKPSKNIDFAVHGAGGRVLVGFANQKHMTSFAVGLKKLQQEALKRNEKLCVIRDARLAVSPGAKAAQQRLEEISKTGHVIRLSAEALAALDAMRHLLAAANSGDLSLAGDSIDADTVRDWLAANLPQEVAALASDILGEAPSEHPPDVLLDVLARLKVLPLEEAARLTGLPQERIEQHARKYPDRIRLFGGPRPVVAQAVAAEKKGDASGAR